MEEEDRHVVLWRKEDPPSEDEINCLKAGKAWDADAFEREKQEKLRQDILNEKEHKERLKNEKVCYSINSQPYHDIKKFLISSSCTIASSETIRTYQKQLQGQVPTPDWRRQRQDWSSEQELRFRLSRREERSQNYGANSSRHQG